MFGKLSWSAIPFDQPIPLLTSGVLILVIVGVLALVTVKGWWPYLWREWITSVDHKRIGVMYCLLGVVMFLPDGVWPPLGRWLGLAREEGDRASGEGER